MPNPQRPSRASSPAEPPKKNQLPAFATLHAPKNSRDSPSAREPDEPRHGGYRIPPSHALQPTRAGQTRSGPAGHRALPGSRKKTDPPAFAQLTRPNYSRRSPFNEAGENSRASEQSAAPRYPYGSRSAPRHTHAASPASSPLPPSPATAPPAPSCHCPRGRCSAEST
jgi:hypothetical protein